MDSTSTGLNSLISTLPQIVPQLPGLFGNALGMGAQPLFNNLPQQGLNMNPQLGNFYGRPSPMMMMPQMPFNSGMMNGGYLNQMMPWGMNPLANNNSNTASLDTALGDYFAAKQSAIQSGGLSATMQSVITAGANALAAKPEDQVAIVNALRSGAATSNFALSQLFSELKLIGLPSWMTQLPSNYSSQQQTYLSTLDQQIAALQQNVTSAQSALTSAATLQDYQTALANLSNLNTQISQLNAQRASAAVIQPSQYSSTPWMSAYSPSLWQGW